MDLKKLTEIEDEIKREIDSWSSAKQAIGYRYLFNIGIRIHDVDRIIKEGMEKEEPRFP